jgi:hypothetical protein
VGGGRERKERSSNILNYEEFSENNVHRGM